VGGKRERKGCEEVISERGLEASCFDLSVGSTRREEKSLDQHIDQLVDVRKRKLEEK
jgi:hypothetical protein